MKLLRFAFLGLLLGGAFASLHGCGCNGTSNNAEGVGKKLKIVSSLPRTGSAQGQTTSIVNGIKLALEEVGYKVGGRTIEYLDLDDATAAAGDWTAEAETNNAQKAANDPEVMAYIGPYNSGAAKISMPILNEEGLLMISPACSWPGLTKPGYLPGEPDNYRPTGKVNFTRVIATDDVQGPIMAIFAAEELKAKTVFILDDTQVYGKGVAGLFEAYCPKVGLKVLGHDSINEKQQEFGGLMNKISKSNADNEPDVIYFGGTTQTKAGQIAKDMVRQGMKCKLLVPDGCYEQAFIDSAGADNLNGRVYLSFGGKDPENLKGPGKKFVDDYKAKYKKMPEAYAIFGYEAAKVALTAIEKAEKNDRAAVLATALSIKDFDQGALGKWSFDANGDTTLQSFTISEVKDGKFHGLKEVSGLKK